MSLLRRLVLIAGLLAPVPAHAAANPEDARLCTDPMSRLEREFDIAPGLLTAIALTESGHRVAADADWAPWPWTVNADGPALYFDTRDEAIAAVQALMRQGVINVDLGCMQINMTWHNGSFTTLEEMFDPVGNVAYAARHLADLKARHGTWEAAIGTYHSGDPIRRAEYLRRVMTQWRGLGGGYTMVAESAEPGLVDRAIAAFRDGHFEEAVGFYRSRLSEAPDDRAAHLGLAATLDRLGRTGEAREAWKGLLILSPGHPRALGRLMEHVRALPPELAIVEAQELHRLDPTAPEPMLFLAGLAADAGRVEDAVALLTRAATLHPDEPIPYLEAAIMLDRSGRPRAALDWYTRFLKRQRARPALLDVPLEDVQRRVAYLRQKTGG